MNNLNKNQVKEIINELENTIAHQECLTCECFQGFLTQLEMDCSQDISDLTGRLKIQTKEMHGCLGCNPCPGGTLFAQYRMSKINN